MTLIKRFFASLLLLFSVAAAQSFPVLNGVVATDSNDLNIPEINRAAEALQAQGVDVLVLFVEADIGDSLGESEIYLDAALESYGLRFSGNYDPELFAIFIGTKALEESNNLRPLYLVYGSNLEGIFGGASTSLPADTRIRETVIEPLLREGQFTQAITAGLRAAESELTGSGSSSSSPSNPPVGLRQLGSLIVFLALLALVIFLFLRSRSKRQTDVEKGNYEKPLPQKPVDTTELKAILADLRDSKASTGHDPYLPEDASKQTDMQLLARLLKDERPQVYQDLNLEYDAAVQSLKSIENRLEQGSLDERNYSSLLLEARGLLKFTQELSEKWEALQLEISEFSQKREASEEAIQTRYAQYQEAALENWPEAKRVFEPFIRHLSDADAHKNKDEALTALTELGKLDEKLAVFDNQLPRLQTISKKLSIFESRLPDYQAQGYALNSSQVKLASAKEQFRVALGLLKQHDLKVLDAQVDEAAELTDALQSEVQTQLDLHRSNTDLLQELEQEGERIKAEIDKGFEYFEKITAYAEASWRDIKGNGTEAQKAANRAYELYQQAFAFNELDDNQDFEEADNLLAAAFAELNHARALLEAIQQRLTNLRKAETTSREELKLVEQDIQERWQYLKREEVDRVVSELPEDNLQKANQLAQEAKQEFAEPRPNWLSILENVQAADKLSDQALEQIRSEEEAMERRRTLMYSEKTEATGALQRLTKYINIHRHDMQDATLRTALQAEQFYDKAQLLESKLAGLEEAQLARQFEEVAHLYDQGQQQADEAFALAEKDFSSMEEAREEVAEILAQTETSLVSLKRYIVQQGMSNTFGQSLYRLQRALPQFDPRAQRQQLGVAMKQAQELELDIERLKREIKEQVSIKESQLRKQRQDQLEQERRRRAAEWGRKASGWGSWPNSGPFSGSPVIISPPRVPRSTKSFPRPSRMPTARSAPRVNLPKTKSFPRTSSRPGSSSWGGSGRKSGGGW